MLKFFRQHNKWLLAVFVAVSCVLMLLYLVMQGPSSKDGPTDGSAVIGQLNDGRKLRSGDLRAARADLETLKRLVQDSPLLAGGDKIQDKEDADRWMLIQAEADRLGVDASESEANTALRILGFEKKDENGKDLGVLNEEGANDAQLRSAVKNYLRAETVRKLDSGAAHDLLSNTGLATPGLQRLAMLRQTVRAEQQANEMARGGSADSETMMQAMNLMMRARAVEGTLAGSQRLSTPLLAHQLQDLNANAAGQLVVIPANTPTRLAQVPAPTDAELQALFEPLKDSPRGAAPNGFGYRLPPRVQVEALGIPIDQVRKLTDDTVTEEQVREWFDDHAMSFEETGGKDAGKPATLTPANREKARAQLRADLAKNKTLEITRACELALAADWRAAAANNNQLPTGTAPTALAVAAEAVKKKFGINPVLLTAAQIQAESVAALAKTQKQPLLHTAGAGEGWMTARELAAHPVLGSATLVSQAGIGLPMIANHLAGGPERQPLPSSLLLAVNLPVPAARDDQNSCWIIRITAASPARAAASLEEVKAQVTDDARELAAYKLLASHARELCGNAAATDGGLAKFASDTDTLSAVPRLTRVDANQAAGPNIPGVGTSDALVKAVFDRAEQLRTRDGGVKGAPLTDRLVAVPIDNLCAMVIFELKDYAPIPKSQYRQLAASPFGRFAAHTATLAERKNPQDPLELESLRKRLGWVAAK